MKSLKEWAAVIRALESGDQTVTLRKGGILDAASGFNVESRKFLLFPTWEHQKEAHVRPEFRRHLRDAEANAPRDGFNMITSYAEALAELNVQDDDTAERLSKLHIWSESYVRARAEWMPSKSLKAVFLKVRRIPPIEVPLLPEHGGCRSWLDINANVPEGEPVLEESTLNSQLDTFRCIAH